MTELAFGRRSARSPATRRHVRAALASFALTSFALALSHGAADAAPRVPPVPHGERSPEQQTIAAELDSLGMPNAVGTYLRHPKAAANILPYFRYVTTATTLPARERELVALRTAWLTRSDYLWAHRAVSARKTGLTDAELTRIAVGPDAAGWKPFEATLLRAADELHVDSFVSDATWQALTQRYDVNQMIDLVYGVGDLTMHAGALRSLGVDIEAGFTDRLPAGIPYTVAARRTNLRLIGKAPRIPPLQPHEWTPELRQQLDPTGSGRPAANVFATFVHNPPVDALRNAVPGHIRASTTLSDRQRELLLTRIGVLCRSEYEYAAHLRAGRRVGITDADVERITKGPDHASGDPLDTALLRATDELYRDDRISDATWAALAASLDTQQLLDVLIAVGGYREGSMAISSAGVQLDDNMAEFRFPPELR
jgi:4-carboxymuconolactone decarboxylase